MTCSACRSSWIFVSILVLSAAPAAAQVNPLQVRAADRELIASEPRQVVATAFSVRNLSAAAIDAESRFVLPAHWQAVTPPAPFVLAPGESALRLVSFAIPEDAAAGDYPVVYEVRDRQHPGFGDSGTVRVRVAAAPRLQVMLVDTPDFAVSGEAIESAAWFRNIGNQALAVHFKIAGRFIAGVTPREGDLQLEPGESRRVGLVVIVGKVGERTAGRLTVTATSAGISLNASDDAVMQLVPRSGALDALHTLQSRVETRYVSREIPGRRSAGWQLGVSGGGVLDESRQDLLRYQIRGPDRRQNGSFGAAEEYWVSYQQQGFAAGAGDLTYGLSPLTEPGRLGRGASLNFREPRWGVSAYGMKDVYGGGDARQFGFGTWLHAAPATTFGLNCLERGGRHLPGTLCTLRALAQWDANFDLDLEAGGSNSRHLRGSAARFALRDDRHAVRWYATGWSADPEFVGPLRDKMYLSAGFDFANPGGWGWRGYYRQQDWNLLPLEQIDPDLRVRRTESDRMYAAPAQRQASVGTGHSLGADTRATLDVIFRDRTGGSPAVELQNLSWRAGINQTWKKLSLFYSLELGESLDRLSGLRTHTSSQMLSGSLRLGQFQSFSAWWMRDDSSEPDQGRGPRRSAGVTAGFDAGNGLGVNLDAQRGESGFGRSAIYEFSMFRETERGSRLTLAARRIEGRFARTDYLLGYSLAFGLPVMRKPGLSTLRGRVFDAETSTGLENVVLRLGGTAIATDHRGEFEFRAVSAGVHQIFLDRGGVDVKQVPASLAPLEVVVSGRDTPPVLIGMVRSAVIAVHVTMHAKDATAAKDAAAILVSFRSGAAVFRRLTDAAGRARLGGIPPGRWQIGVAEDALPAGYGLDGEVELDPGPGESVSAELVLAPRRREMRMLEPLAVR